MDAPICRLCKTKHWSREPCPSRPTRVARHRPLKPAPTFSAHLSEQPREERLASSEPATKHQRWSREAYNAYQREYMRKRRAAARRLLKAKARKRAKKRG